ncbi:LysR substrate-binding domain-containing protein [Pseudomonas caricapapayae]|uniref:LysR substrate-binding domain-containing protein n=1 Tax=Pseudomonas caricapapayae TaxID=46678 RepID=UPI0006D5D5E8|nr:hypothetical protein F4W67_05500 [Pseudomonas caricapapayae]
MCQASCELDAHRHGDNDGEILRCDPLLWVAAEGFRMQPDRPLPLALYPHGCGYRRRILSALSSSGRDYEIAFECSGVKGVELAVESGLAVAATAVPLIQPGWQVLDAKLLHLPNLGNAMTELRRGRGESTAGVQYFAQNLISRVAR